MRLPIALAAALVLGCASATAQDFSITNQVAPSDANRRDVMRQLQAWWDLHAYYPRHASNNDEGGTVKLHLVIHPDGNVWSIDVVQGSGSPSLDNAASATFTGGFVRPFPAGAPETTLDLTLHYILAHRHDEPTPARVTPATSSRPFTIANDPVTSPILETMLQRTCTGEVVKQGIRNHPTYGAHYWAQAVFFRRPDGTPWVKFYEGGFSVIAPVTEVGKLVQWTGREERVRAGVSKFYQYTAWSDGANCLSGTITSSYPPLFGEEGINTGGTVDLTCAVEVVPAVEWNAWYVNKVQTPPGDPP